MSGSSLRLTDRLERVAVGRNSIGFASPGVGIDSVRDNLNAGGFAEATRSCRFRVRSGICPLSCRDPREASLCRTATTEPVLHRTSGYAYPRVKLPARQTRSLLPYQHRPVVPLRQCSCARATGNGGEAASECHQTVALWRPGPDGRDGQLQGGPLHRHHKAHEFCATRTARMRSRSIERLRTSGRCRSRPKTSSS